MYVRRDQGSYFIFISKKALDGTVVPPEIKQPHAAWLANDFAFGLGKVLKAACIWGLSLSVLVAIMTATLKNIRLGTYLSYENLLQQGLFGKITIFYAAFALTQIAGWAGEETEKRLELILSVPLTRWRLLLGRLTVAGMASALVVGLTGLAFWPAAILAGLEVNGWNVVAAFLGLWVLCLVIEALGFVLTAFGPNLAVAVLAGLVALSFFFEILAEAFNLPGWLVNLSIFHQYGEPVVDGLDAGVIVALIATSLLLAIVATVGFERRDIAK